MFTFPISLMKSAAVTWLFNSRKNIPFDMNGCFSFNISKNSAFLCDFLLQISEYLLQARTKYLPQLELNLARSNEIELFSA